MSTRNQIHPAKAVLIVLIQSRYKDEPALIRVRRRVTV